MTGLLTNRRRAALDRASGTGGEGPPIAPGPIGRRAVLGGIGAASGALLLAGCATGRPGGYGLVDAVRELLLLSSQRAFDRLTAPDGFWDRQVAQLGLNTVIGTRGPVLARILASPLFKARMEDAFAGFAVAASARAAPVVTDAVRAIGIQGALQLVQGGPMAATAFLRQGLGDRLIAVMVPELTDALRVPREPLVTQTLSALAGVNVATLADRLADRVDDTIWDQIGREEAAIRADPAATRDPLLIGVLGGARAATGALRR